jgi:hypothetical protein
MTDVDGILDHIDRLGELGECSLGEQPIDGIVGPIEA